MTERGALHLFGTIIEKRAVQTSFINKNEPRWRLLDSKVNPRNTQVFQDEIRRLSTSDSEAGCRWLRFKGYSSIGSFKDTKE